jgi:hypothetical protein
MSILRHPVQGQIACAHSFAFHNGNWYLINERLRDLMDVTTGTLCPPGNPMQLQEGQQILLTREEGGRLAFVQMVDS